MTFYVLMGKLAVPAKDVLEWSRWFETAERQIALTTIGPIRISTVFIGLKGQLFETMIFRGRGGDEMWRYTSYQDAVAGHEAAVAKVRAEIVANAKEPPQSVKRL